MWAYDAMSQVMDDVTMDDVTMDIVETNFDFSMFMK